MYGLSSQYPVITPHFSGITRKFIKGPYVDFEQEAPTLHQQEIKKKNSNSPKGRKHFIGTLPKCLLDSGENADNILKGLNRLAKMAAKGMKEDLKIGHVRLCIGHMNGSMAQNAFIYLKDDRDKEPIAKPMFVLRLYKKGLNDRHGFYQEVSPALRYTQCKKKHRAVDAPDLWIANPQEISTGRDTYYGWGLFEWVHHESPRHARPRSKNGPTILECVQADGRDHTDGGKQDVFNKSYLNAVYDNELNRVIVDYGGIMTEEQFGRGGYKRGNRLHTGDYTDYREDIAAGEHALIEAKRSTKAFSKTVKTSEVVHTINLLHKGSGFWNAKVMIPLEMIRTTHSDGKIGLRMMMPNGVEAGRVEDVFGKNHMVLPSPSLVYRPSLESVKKLLENSKEILSGWEAGKESKKTMQGEEDLELSSTYFKVENRETGRGAVQFVKTTYQNGQIDIRFVSPDGFEYGRVKDIMGQQEQILLPGDLYGFPTHYDLKNLVNKIVSQQVKNEQALRDAKESAQQFAEQIIPDSAQQLEVIELSSSDYKKKETVPVTFQRVTLDNGHYAIQALGQDGTEYGREIFWLVEDESGEINRADCETVIHNAPFKNEPNSYDVKQALKKISNNEALKLQAKKSGKEFEATLDPDKTEVLSEVDETGNGTSHHVIYYRVVNKKTGAVGIRAISAETGLELARIENVLDDNTKKINRFRLGSFDISSVGGTLYNLRMSERRRLSSSL